MKSPVVLSSSDVESGGVFHADPASAATAKARHAVQTSRIGRAQSSLLG
jgi:hypothetical protein